MKKLLIANIKHLSLCITVLLSAYSDVVIASKCGSNEELTLKIVYEAEDYANCRDPSLAGLPPATPRGITKAVLYQSATKRRKELIGQCVTPTDVVGGNIVHKNLEYHIVRIRTKKQTSYIDMVEQNGSIRGGSSRIFEVGLKAYTTDEYENFKKMEILPEYTCGVIPPLPQDPSRVKLCVTDISGMRVILYKEIFRIGSDELNWYKAKSIEKICASNKLFEPPTGINLKRL